ncbi:hypothetical protein ACS0TY_000158 [Phlomoides rotata]
MHSLIGAMIVVSCSAPSTMFHPPKCCKSIPNKIPLPNLQCCGYINWSLNAHLYEYRRGALLMFYMCK